MSAFLLQIKNVSNDHKELRNILRINAEKQEREKIIINPNHSHWNNMAITTIKDTKRVIDQEIITINNAINRDLKLNKSKEVQSRQTELGQLIVQADSVLDIMKHVEIKSNAKKQASE